MKIKTELHEQPVDIKVALDDYASQEGNGGGEYALMFEAASYIAELESDYEELVEAIESLPVDLEELIGNRNEN